MHIHRKIFLATVVFVMWACFLFFILHSCKEVGQGKNREGIIEYKVTYLENTMSKNIPTNLLPGKMILKFKNDKSIISIDGFMGLFSLTIINDHKKRVSVSLMKVINKKYFYESEPGESSFCFKEIPGMKVELRRGIKEISGLQCKRGRVSFPNSDQEPFIFYYTDDISIKSPNYDNPYSMVDGVLIKFQIKLNKLRMELMADKIKLTEISNNEFKIPDGYRKVSKTDMEDILNTLME